MCHHPDPSRAIALAHGAAHAHDHAAWTRRDFLVRSGLAAVGGAVLVGGAPARAMAPTSLVAALGHVETDRVLVLIQLQGGNDGLNTVVPYRNDLYANARPTLRLGAADVLDLDGDVGLHSALTPLRGLWDQGDLAIVRNVGYPEQDLSHFRGTDIWLSGSPVDEVWTTGWAGRTLAPAFPDFDAAPPAAPPAVQIGTTAPLLFEGDGTGYGMSIRDVDTFLRLAAGGEAYPTEGLPDTPAGQELAFARRIANDAFRYREAIYTATQAARNEVTYPATTFGRELAAVAQLIKGRLDSRIFLVSLGSFDTHADQAGRHAELLGTLAGALDAFFRDLQASGDDDRTLAVTFSEFGRRVEENGSKGTDHGTAAPLFVAGPAAVGGLAGAAPDLAALNADGNPSHDVDFRQVYATVIEHWLGLDATLTAQILGGTFDTLPVVTPFGTASSAAPTAEAVRLDPPAPNPAAVRTEVRFALAEPVAVRLDLFDVRGRRLATLADGLHAAGAHRVGLDVAGLPSGVYLVRLDAGSRSVTTRLTVAR